VLENIKFRALSLLGCTPRCTPLPGWQKAMQVSDGSNADIWVYDQQRDATTKLTFGGGIYSAPV